ncbi:hypothetical protein KR51_00029910 [Rubidibacter lacunae KORDI 51-2]|uniref:Uncharacterized protein n=1 Tax=Rubidibacter lacunae KORDI 51-2 TaxID=582515 RepID=U5DL47_9CHRO|nr:hypothetical protein KR51_00029910 [Rubidibacter lacunae KORDI 51-2]
MHNIPLGPALVIYSRVHLILGQQHIEEVDIGFFVVL